MKKAISAVLLALAIVFLTPVVVQQIVRLHAGSVTVQSTLGEGTTFTVQLPVK